MKIRLIGKSYSGIGYNWRNYFKEVVKSKFNSVVFLEDFWDYGLGPAVVAHDALLIKDADIIIANCDEEVGPGTAMEYLIAKKYNKFVITVIGKNSSRRKSRKIGEEIISDWIHPFIETFSDRVLEKIEDISNNLDLSHPKGLDEIDRLISLIDNYRSYKGIDSKISSLFK